MNHKPTRSERQRQQYVQHREQVLADPEAFAAYEEGLDSSTFPFPWGQPVPSARDQLSIYIPQAALAERPIERLAQLAKAYNRSVNYLVVRAISEFLEREDKPRSRSRH
jgi:hypothetical protein